MMWSWTYDEDGLDCNTIIIIIMKEKTIYSLFCLCHLLGDVRSSSESYENLVSILQTRRIFGYDLPEYNGSSISFNVICLSHKIL